MTEGFRNLQPGGGNLSDLFQDNQKLPLPIIPMRFERPNTAHTFPSINFGVNIPSGNSGLKLLPDYNFQSLFRKKSHIRLAKNKKKQQAKGGNRSEGYKQDSLKESRHIKKGHWTAQQNKLYHWFLQIHNQHFIMKHLRRTDKIFKSMATFIGTREAEQCRSHHQKMEKKYRSFYKIIIKLRSQFYASAGCEQLRADLHDNGYSLKEDQLMTETELKADSGRLQTGQRQDKSGPGNSGDHQAQIDGESVSLQGQNLLGENYESGFNCKLYQR